MKRTADSPKLWSRRLATTTTLLMTLCILPAQQAVRASVAAPTHARTSVSASGCQLANGIQHVIFIEFDNTHFMRDIARNGQANVPSDLEQMPHLLNFLETNGVVLSNHHNQLISHTSDGITASESGLYPGNNGVALSENSYYQYTADDSGTVPESGFNYWTSKTPNGTPAFVYQDGKNPPAPWVPYTRAGCNVGGVAMSGMVLENNADIDNVFGAGTAAAAGSNATPWYIGLSVHCAQGATLCDPAHGGVPDVLPDEPGGYTGYNAIFGHKQLTTALQATGALTSSGNITDLYGNVIKTNGGTVGFPSFNLLPQFALGYTAKLQESGVPVTYAYIITPHRPVLGPSGYTDDQGNGYGVANGGNDYAPGEAGYVQQLHEYDHAFDTFFTRLKNDGIDQSNTLFVVTAEEGDHHISEVPTPATCDGVTVACTYPTVSNAGLLPSRTGELALNYQGLLLAENPSITATLAISTKVNNDDAPDFYLPNNPGPSDPTTRALERATAAMTATNLLTATQNVLNGTSLPAVENVTQYLADQNEYKILHTYVVGDPSRMATFTSFNQPDYYSENYTSPPFSSPSCDPSIAAGTVNPCTPQSTAFNWNHGNVQPQITTIWLGLVGPGVQVKGLDGPDPTTEAIETQSSPLQATMTLTGTWSDHVDDRPTMMALLGLQDNIKEDGRVLSEVMTSSALPAGISADQSDYEALAQTYKQCNAPLGLFNQQTLITATNAIASGSSSDDSAFTTVTAQLNALRAQRDAIAGDGDATTTPPGTAGTMQTILHAAAFDGTPVDPATAHRLIDGCRALMGLAPLSSTVTPTATPTTSPTATPTATATTTPLPPTDTATATPTPTARLAVSLSRAVPFQTITVTGTGFGVAEQVGIYLDSAAHAPLATPTTDASGSFVTTITVPQAVSGVHVVLARGLYTGRVASTSLVIQSELLVVPHRGHAGSTAFAAGFGLGAHDLVVLTWDRPLTVVGLVTTNGIGSFSGSGSVPFMIPAGAAAGRHYLAAYSVTSKTSVFAVYTVVRR